MHDVSDGGLLVAIAEMALAGEIGVQLFPYEGKLPAHAAWFGEDQGRYVLEADARRWPRRSSSARGCWRCRPAWSARVGGDALALKGEPPLPWTTCAAGHEAWLPSYMGTASVYVLVDRSKRRRLLRLCGTALSYGLW